ncbi:hypothetical protein [Mycobacterium sp. IS-836]|uniref:hypothetical protein n=1 Tax=Mycobacterium sp. IS-836 TaxID=1834160 RepID=UPI0013016CD4|nr:hypothetical protein [Mycobacterium sp. IS-836]
MADTTRDIHEVVRENWTLADLRSLVDAVPDWPADSPVCLWGADSGSSRGVISVQRDV